MKIDAHHHLWDLSAVHYPWLMAPEVRFFGDPAPIRRNYLVEEFRRDAQAAGVAASVHIQVGAQDPLAEARWIDQVARETPGWPAAQVAFLDLTDPEFEILLDAYQTLDSIRGVRQIVGRAPGEDAATGTNALLDDPAFLRGLRILVERGFSFDLQLIPELMEKTAAVFADVPELDVVLCHAGSPHDRSSRGIATWRENLRFISQLPNFKCKLSGLGMFEHDWNTASIRPLVESCVDQFTPARCMWGSNFPVDSLTSDYQYLSDAYDEILMQYPAADRDRILGGTAAEFYRL